MAAQRMESTWYDGSGQDGFELGRDHARHGRMPPVEHLAPGNPVGQGWLAARARFANRTLADTPQARKWLDLRLQAWVGGRPFETMSVTAHYIGQIAASHCPVTRHALVDVDRPGAHGGPHRPVIARLRPADGYTAGHLATLSAVADAARADRSWLDADRQARRIDAAGGGRIEGLASDAWRRLGVLLSFVTPLAHAQAVRVPLLVLPPNRLHLCNPVQALQVLTSRLLAHSGWSGRLHALLGLLHNDNQREDFQRFFLALLARTIEAGRPTDPLRRRWALEDAWRDTEVQQLWWQFALQIDADAAESLIARAAERGLLDQRVLLHGEEPGATGRTGPIRVRLPAGAQGPGGRSGPASAHPPRPVPAQQLHLPLA